MSYHLFSRKAVTARKPHICIWCAQWIVRGDVYYREASVYDGTHQNFAWHWDCWHDSHETYFQQNGEDEFVSGQDRPSMLPFRSMEAA